MGIQQDNLGNLPPQIGLQVGSSGEQDWIKSGLDWAVVSSCTACHISALCVVSESLLEDQNYVTA